MDGAWGGDRPYDQWQCPHYVKRLLQNHGIEVTGESVPDDEVDVEHDRPDPADASTHDEPTAHQDHDDSIEGHAHPEAEHDSSPGHPAPPTEANLDTAAALGLTRLNIGKQFCDQVRLSCLVLLLLPTTLTEKAPYFHDH